jgi:hypothetical protein
MERLLITVAASGIGRMRRHRTAGYAGVLHLSDLPISAPRG